MRKSHEYSDEEFSGKDKSEAIREALSQLRSELLDLSARNPLLNSKYTRGKKFLQIVDELPSQLAEDLLAGKSFKFAAIPELKPIELKKWQEENKSEGMPSSEVLAKVASIDLNVELPKMTRDEVGKRHEDNEIQTKYQVKEMEARLSNIKKIADSFIQETGLNTLYLVLGHLDWYESKSNKNHRSAPLFTIPVILEKGKLDPKTKTYIYTISYSGEDLIANASLAQRLLRDFEYKLPAIPENKDVEEYFRKLEDSIKDRFPEWVVRRNATLTFLNFGKLLMYQDLDPDSWPEEKALEKNRLIRNILAGDSETTSDQQKAMADAHFVSEYSIDKINDVHKLFPLVDSADSSQHSAVIDAVKGKDMVIEGPPGAGKSQTITNLIAACIHSGKSVLFVSEKMAALEVVKNRLTKLGLGDFCLELHSHATQKMGVIDSLKSRLELHANDPRGKLSSVILENNQQRDKLTSHAELMNKMWVHTNMSVHDIFSATTQESRRLPKNLTKLCGEVCSNHQYTEEDIKKTARTTSALYDALIELRSNGIDHIHKHPWYGVTAATLNISHREAVTRLLEEWTEALVKLSQLSASDSLLADFIRLETHESINVLLNCLKNFPKEIERVSWSGVRWVLSSSANQKNLLNLLRSTEELKTLLDFTDPPLTWTQLEQLDPIAEESLFDNLAKAGFSENYTFSQLDELLTNFEDIRNNVYKILSPIQEFENVIGEKLPQSLRSEFISEREIRLLPVAIEYIDRMSDEVLNARDAGLLEEDIQNRIKAIEVRLPEYFDLRDKVSPLFNLTDLPPSEQIQQVSEILSDSSLFKSIFNKEYKLAKNTAISVLKKGESTFDSKTISKQLTALVDYKASADSIDVLVRNISYTSSYLSEWKKHEIKDLNAYINFHRWVFSSCKKQTSSLFSSSEVSDLGRWLCDSPVKQVKLLVSFKKVNLEEIANNLNEKLKIIRKSFEGNKCFEVDNTLPINDLVSSGGGVSSIQVLATQAHELLSHPLITLPLDLKNTKIAAERLNTSLIKFAEIKDQIRKLNSEVFLGEVNTDVEYFDHIIAQIESTNAFASALSDNNSNEVKKLKAAYAKNADLSFHMQIMEWASLVQDSLRKERSAYSEFDKKVSLKLSEWNPISMTLASLIKRNTKAIEAPNDFTNYIHFLSNKEELNKLTSEMLAEELLSGSYSRQEFFSATRYFIMKSLSEGIIHSVPELQNFQGAKQEQLRKNFKTTDAQLLSLQRSSIKYTALQRPIPQGQSGARVSELTEYNLVVRETNKQKRHIPIRQLINRAGRAIQALKPCFMMGPRSVAQYLEPGGLEFDILVIDEASQLKPSEALGASARAKQMVVVGDPKQLPPTSFFDQSTSSNEEEDEDEVAISSSESILEAVLPIFTARRLRWHYRSRHETLIAFSNQNFYNNNLLLFPAPMKSDEKLGIKHVYLPNGCYKDNVNETEAQVISARLEELLVDNPSTSVGIATMNTKQRDLIEMHIEEKAKQNPIFDEALSKNTANFEGYFVKNLETIQGDERDIILISCTYGPSDPGGRVYQRFGPINSDVGWRRLNVLFTRSRCRMEIYTSINSSDILSDSGSRGVKAFRAFLHYAESGTLHTAEATEVSAGGDFQTAVAEALSLHGFDCDFQIGVAGFFIDLAVKHPNNPNKYILAIECDGATYHSSKSARDRDCLRQEILESLGWNIERIWSTDWLNNPQSALAPVIRLLKIVSA